MTRRPRRARRTLDDRLARRRRVSAEQRDTRREDRRARQEMSYA